MSVEVYKAFKLSNQLLGGVEELKTLLGWTPENERVFQQVAADDVFQFGDLYILGSFMAGSELHGCFGVRLQTQALLLWRVVKKGQVGANQRQADALMDGVLHNIRAVTFENYVFTCVRERPYYNTVRDGSGDPYTEVGGFYRYHISASEV